MNLKYVRAMRITCNCEECGTVLSKGYGGWWDADRNGEGIMYCSSCARQATSPATPKATPKAPATPLDTYSGTDHAERLCSELATELVKVALLASMSMGPGCAASIQTERYRGVVLSLADMLSELSPSLIPMVRTEETVAAAPAPKASAPVVSSDPKAGSDTPRATVPPVVDEARKRAAKAAGIPRWSDRAKTPEAATAPVKSHKELEQERIARIERANRRAGALAAERDQLLDDTRKAHAGIPAVRANGTTVCGRCIQTSDQAALMVAASDTVEPVTMKRPGDTYHCAMCETSETVPQPEGLPAGYVKCSCGNVTKSPEGLCSACRSKRAAAQAQQQSMAAQAVKRGASKRAAKLDINW